MKTISEILDLSTTFLSQKGFDRSRREAEELLSLVLKLPRIELYLQFDRLLDPVELDLLRLFLKKRSQKMPWQYIVGTVQFLKIELEVTPDVLIPRQETEFLAEKVIEAIGEESLTVWDICSGSGCLGISIKHQRPDCSVILSDISLEAVELAKKNAAKNDVHVDIWHGDLLEAFQGLKADIIVCNPPYISEQDYHSLELEVKQWEPKLALVGGETGYEFYEKLAKTLAPHLYKTGSLYLEIGTGMGEHIKTLFLSHGWKFVEVFKDYASHDRFVKVSGHAANA
ncbi:MAG: peptide chain release factor N(5)-glutamine methyltransferase [Candidatus Rhabdochlamydia sp.]